MRFHQVLECSMTFRVFPLPSIGFVIVMTFRCAFWNGLTFFELFKLYFHLGLITTPHVLYVHMTYV